MKKDVDLENVVKLLNLTREEVLQIIFRLNAETLGKQ